MTDYGNGARFEENLVLIEGASLSVRDGDLEQSWKPGK